MRPLFLLALLAVAIPAPAAQQVSQDRAGQAPPVIDDASLLPPALKRKVDFVSEVQPLLRDTCFDCHSSGNEEGSLNLGIRQRTLEGGEHGRVLIPGDSVTAASCT